MKPWMIQRAKALHRMCEGIALDISSDVARGRAYSRGRSRFNSTKIARLRGIRLCLSAVRAHYAKWRLQPTVDVFESRWGSPQPLIIGPAFCRELSLRAIHLRITAGGLYDRLKTEVPNLSFSKATLLLHLPVHTLRAVSDAQRLFDSVINKALKEIEAIQ